MVNSYLFEFKNKKINIKTKRPLIRSDCMEACYAVSFSRISPLYQQKYAAPVCKITRKNAVKHHTTSIAGQEINTSESCCKVEVDAGQSQIGRCAAKQIRHSTKTWAFYRPHAACTLPESLPSATARLLGTWTPESKDI